MATELVPLERDIQKSITDLFDAELIPYWRMNAGNRYGSYTSKRTGKTRGWCIKGHPKGTADLLVAPRISRHFPFGPYRLLGLNGCDVSLPIFLWIETKRVHEKQTPEQVRFELECINRGHAYLRADDVDTVRTWLAEHGWRR